MKIWILTKTPKRPPKRIKRFLTESEHFDCEVTLVASNEFEIEFLKSGTGKIWHKKSYIDLPHIFISSIIDLDYFDLSLLRYLEQEGVLVLNKADGIQNANDKLLTIQLLTRSPLPIPKSIVAKSGIDINFIIKQIGTPLVLKTVTGCKGEGVILIPTEERLKHILEILEHTKRPSTNLIFQEYIGTSHGRDIRVMVIGGKVIGAALREGGAGEFKANVAAGGKASAMTLDQTMIQLATKAAEALKLDIAGVDLLFDKNGYQIAEVNAAPNFSDFESASGTNVVKAILEYAIHQVNQSKS